MTVRVQLVSVAYGRAKESDSEMIQRKTNERYVWFLLETYGCSKNAMTVGIVLASYDCSATDVRLHFKWLYMYHHLHRKSS